MTKKNDSVSSVVFWCSTLGSVGGGYAWLLITGILNGLTMWSLFAVGCAIVAIGVAWKYYRIHTIRLKTILGLLFFFLVITNMLAVHFVWNDIPDRISGMSTGKHGLDAGVLQIFIAGFSLFGFWFIFQDMASWSAPNE